MTIRLGRSLTLVTIIILVVSGGLLAWSRLSQQSAWWSGLLLQFGSTLFLVVPLAILSHGIETRIDTVREQQERISTRQEQTASDVARLTEEVAQTQADLRLTREQLSEVVRQRIATMKDRDSALFKEVGETPSRINVLDSLLRAQRIGIISDQGCRINLFDTERYLRFKPEWSDPITSQSEEPDVIELTLEEMDATPLSRIQWDDESNPSDVAIRIVEAMQASGTYPGDAVFDAGNIFADLSALLSLGHNSATSGKIYPLKHIIQLCPPQWAICDDGVYATKDAPYKIAARRLTENWISHMAEKSWVDINSLDEAVTTCGELYESGALAVKPPHTDEPPF